MAVDTIYLKNEQGVDVPYQLGADSRNVTYSPNAETVEGSVHKELQQNNIHKNTIIANSTGVHGLRYIDNKLQVQAPGGGWTPVENGDMKKVDYDDPDQNGVIAIAHGGTGNTSGYVRAGAKSGNPVGEKSTAEGGDTIAGGYCCHAEGKDTQAEGYASHAEGYQTKVTGLYSHAEGQQSTASGDCSHAEGEAFALARFGHAENTSTVAENAEAAHAEGVLTRAEGQGSHSEGGHTTAIGSYSHAGGEYTKANGDCSFAQGKGTSSSQAILNGNAAFGIMNMSHRKFGDSTMDGTRFTIQTEAPVDLQPSSTNLDGTNGLYFDINNDSGSIFSPSLIELAKGGMYLLFVNATETTTASNEYYDRAVYFITRDKAGAHVVEIVEETNNAVVTVTGQSYGSISIVVNNAIAAQCQLIRIA